MVRKLSRPTNSGSRVQAPQATMLGTLPDVQAASKGASHVHGTMQRAARQRGLTQRRHRRVSVTWVPDGSSNCRGGGCCPHRREPTLRRSARYRGDTNATPTRHGPNKRTASAGQVRHRSLTCTRDSHHGFTAGLAQGQYRTSTDQHRAGSGPVQRGVRSPIQSENGPGCGLTRPRARKHARTTRYQRERSAPARVLSK